MKLVLESHKEKQAVFQAAFDALVKALLIADQDVTVRLSFEYAPPEPTISWTSKGLAFGTIYSGGRTSANFSYRDGKREVEMVLNLAPNTVDEEKAISTTGFDNSKRMRIFAHEMGHVKQMVLGQLGEPDRKGNVKWLDKTIHIPSIEYAERPWEQDADALATKFFPLVQHLEQAA